MRRAVYEMARGKATRRGRALARRGRSQTWLPGNLLTGTIVERIASNLKHLDTRLREDDDLAARTVRKMRRLAPAIECRRDSAEHAAGCLLVWLDREPGNVIAFFPRREPRAQSATGPPPIAL